MLRLQFLTIKFENLKMHDDENIYEFNVYLSDITYHSFDLGEKIFDKKLLEKI